MLMKSQNVWHLNEGFLFQVMRRILDPLGPGKKRERGVGIHIDVIVRLTRQVRKD